MTTWVNSISTKKLLSSKTTLITVALFCHLQRCSLFLKKEKKRRKYLTFLLCELSFPHFFPSYSFYSNNSPPPPFPVWKISSPLLSLLHSALCCIRCLSPNACFWLQNSPTVLSHCFNVNRMLCVLPPYSPKAEQTCKSVFLHGRLKL